ncbi:MAG: ASCH domain-containing protein [Phycisphaerales bacterium]|nr:ASCH domain-containing protein [Phycisphaerales bacterium]
MITSNPKQVEAFIDRFREANPLKDPGIATRPVMVDSFGDSSDMADRLLALVLDGTKTATCSALWAWEHDNETPLVPGTLAAILDGAGNARCILETRSVTPTAFKDVDEQFAYDEGEGDRTLKWWRQAHWDFFSRTLPEIGKEPSEDMILLCERFRVIYSEE